MAIFSRDLTQISPGRPLGRGKTWSARHTGPRLAYRGSQPLSYDAGPQRQGRGRGGNPFSSPR